jgi:hypothetical protein
LEALGHVVVVMDEDYKHDLIASYPVKMETEVKKGWTGAWPSAWKTVRIPARKQALLSEPSKIIFWVLNQACTEAWRIHGRELTQARLQVVDTKKKIKDEQFFCIPIEACTLTPLMPLQKP